MSCSCSFIVFFPGQQYLPRDGHIIERYHPIGDGLSFFVSFAGQEHQVTRPRFGNGQGDGAVAIGLDEDFGWGLLEPRQHLFDDGQRVFSPRIIRSKYNHVAAFSSRLPHERALGTITIATAAEHGDDPAASAAHKRTRCGDDIAQGIVGVGVVDHDGKILPAIDGLESAWHIVQERCALRDLVERQAAGDGSCARSQQIIDIDASGKAGGDGDNSVRGDHGEAHARGLHLQTVGAKVALAQAVGVEQLRTCGERGLFQAGAVFIVNVEDGRARRWSSRAIEELSFGGKVFLHAAVIIEMVAGKVGEDGHIEMKPEDPLLVKGVGGNLHHRLGRAAVHAFTK